MNNGHLLATFLIFFIQIGIFLWISLKDPGLATIPIIEFEDELSRDQIK